MEPTPLTPEQREKILSELHQRQALEAEALKQEQQARLAESERVHAESLAAEHARRESERRSYILGLLQQSFNELGKAIAAFSEENNETQCYRLMARIVPNLVLAQQRLTQPIKAPITGSLPTVRVRRAGTAQGWCIVNAQDVLPSDEILEES